MGKISPRYSQELKNILSTLEGDPDMDLPSKPSERKMLGYQEMAAISGGFDLWRSSPGGTKLNRHDAVHHFYSTD